MTTTRLRTHATQCPVCGTGLRLLGRLLVGEVIGCGRCGAQLEVAEPDPPVLEPFARVDEEEEELEGRA